MDPPGVLASPQIALENNSTRCRHGNAFASSLWTAPAAYLALSNGYTGHGIGYVIVTVLGIAGMAGLMHFFGIRQERDLNGAE